MTSLVLTFPDFDPVALQLGPLAIHWYGVMYALAFALGYVLLRRRIRHLPFAHLTAWPWPCSRSRGAITARSCRSRTCWSRWSPWGLGLGHLGNFINGELWGRPADPSLPWAMVFPRVDAVPRHPSKLYAHARPAPPRSVADTPRGI